MARLFDIIQVVHHVMARIYVENVKRHNHIISRLLRDFTCETVLTWGKYLLFSAL